MQFGLDYSLILNKYVLSFTASNIQLNQQKNNRNKQHPVTHTLADNKQTSYTRTENPSRKIRPPCREWQMTGFHNRIYTVTIISIYHYEQSILTPWSDPFKGLWSDQTTLPVYHYVLKNIDLI